MTSLPPHRPHCALLALMVVGLCTAAMPASAQPLAALRYAPDVTIGLGATLVGGGVLAADDLGGTVTLVDIADLPPAARIAAAHRLDNGSLLLAFESAVTLPGAGVVEPRDLVVYDPVLETFTLDLEGASVGIPDGAHIDALARLGDGTTLLSLDVSAGVLDDEDIGQVDGPGLMLYLDFSAIGLAPALDVDGLDVEESGSVRVFVSTDGSGSVDGVSFDDEDVLVYDLGDQTWSLGFDASASTPAWPAAADLIAVDVELEATATPTASATPSPSVTATFTATAVPATATATSTLPPATATATAPPATATSTAVSTATGVPTATDTRVPTSTATIAPSAPTTATNTPVASATATATGPLATATNTPTGPLATATNTATPVVTTTAGPPLCAGDCNGSGEVTIDELITLVNIALGTQPLTACPEGDLDQNGAVTINEIIAAVSSALNGCS